MTSLATMQIEFHNACVSYQQCKKAWERDTKNNKNFKLMMDALLLKRKLRKKLEDQGIDTDKIEDGANRG